MNKYESIYKEILDGSQKIRSVAMSDWGDIIMFGGSLPSEVSADLATAAKITGVVFDALVATGHRMSQVAGKEDLFCITLDDKTYTCHKLAIPSLTGTFREVDDAIVKAVGFGDGKDKQPEPKPLDSEPEPTSDVFDSVQEKETDEDLIAPDSEAVLEEPLEEPVAEPYDSSEEDDATTGAENEGVFKDVEDAEDAEGSEDSLPSQAPFEKRGAEVIGGEPTFGTLQVDDLFIEESSKKECDIIYETFVIDMTHSGMGGGGKPEEFRVFVAPLKISKVPATSVPIIVALYNKGKIVQRSSYDQIDQGKNLVTIDCKDFYFLVRGSFDAEGNFRAMITTTGFSATQGDIMNIVSNRRYGDPSSPTVGNGHIKMRVSIDDAPGILEAFPFGDPEDNDFVVVAKSQEFVDYSYMSSSGAGLKKMYIYNDGMKQTVTCRWDNGEMVVELVEV